MEYISKSEFSFILKSYLDQIDGLNWSNNIPINSFVDSGKGIMVLMDNKERFVYVSATNNFNQRLNELLVKENVNGRFDSVKYVKISEIDQRNQRFSERRLYKNTMLLRDTPMEQIDNILDDNDPRIITRTKEYSDFIRTRKC